MRWSTGTKWIIGCLTVLAAVSLLGDVAWSAPGSKRVQELFELNETIDAQEERLEKIQKDIEQHRRAIIAEQGRARTLEQHIVVLDGRIAKKRLEIEEVQTKRERVELEIRAAKLELERIGERASRHRELLAALLVQLRTVDVRPPLHVVLADASIGAYAAERARIARLQEHLQHALVRIRTERDAVAAQERELRDHEQELSALTISFSNQQQALTDEQQGKARLLTQTQRNEERYQKLVEDLRAEAEQVDREIVALEARVRQQLSEIDAQFGSGGHVAFSWPVPNRGITAYFHDPEYPYRHLFEHNAIDIRAAQAATITAPAPGYVAKTKDNGLGYSYLVLVHPGGFSSVYGHVSCFKVEEGTYVERGDPLACVGGRPGTRGAGQWTTGSHLHFEIRLNGVPVNPLNYLI